jgi:hypothetical protein
MDLREVKHVGGVVLQGRNAASDARQRAKSVTILVSTDGINFVKASGMVDTSMTRYENKYAYFPAPVSARYVRVVVHSWAYYISVRAAVLFGECTPHFLYYELLAYF